MALFGMFKKKKEFDIPSEDDLLVPEAPSSFKSDLPDFPEDESFKIKEEIELPKAPKTFSPIDRMESRIVAEEKNELGQREELVTRKPVFVDSNNYKLMYDEMEQVRLLLKEGENSMNRVAELKSDKDKEFKKWKATSEDIMKKLIYVDRVLFKKSETY